MLDHTLDICNRFGLNKEILKIKPYGSGHINKSWLITNIRDQQKFLLQRINHHVFPDAAALMNNIRIVTNHIENKKTTVQVPRFLEEEDGNLFLSSEDGSFWRLMEYISPGYYFDVVENKQIVFEGGKAFGEFIAALSDLDTDKLRITLQDFHNITKRIEQYKYSLSENKSGRAELVKEEILFVADRFEEMSGFYNELESGKYKLRVTHNDTKINNVLFNESNQAIAVIDLDTVMPGYVHFDFGDAIRTFANTAPEDETCLNKVKFNFDYFRSFSEGFLEKSGNYLTEVEIRALPFSAKYMTFLIGLRFLTDYLNGDIYYKTIYDNHNLLRAKVQFKLLDEIENHFNEIQSFLT
ncbi:MAG: aminoglycoside phosphotransferase family protein [Bacteroidales bacterium]|nr:aminoglycoside phosphotransferase family protein [Bacteroidales bacterium]